MPLNRELVNEISSAVRILKDTVEYHWLVGCWPTAVANVIGYWDRNGFDNLIEGDSSTFSEDVKNAIASPEHYRDYYKDYLDFNPDASSSTKLDAHENNSIADFLLSSRQGEGLRDGWTSNNMVGIGLHGYATDRGYNNFETSYLSWGKYTFNDITNEIDAGRPVLLSIDTDANGATDHGVVVYGYDSNTQELIIHDGWSSTDDLRRIQFSPVANGTEWGIASATFVNPTSSNPSTSTPQVLHLTDDGSGWAATYEGTLNASSGQFNTKLKASDANLSRQTLGLASADGHTFYQLYDDGRGTAQLGRALYDGSGKFRWKSLNNDSNLSRDTLALATADGKQFYSLLDDGAGTAALYSAQLQNDATFTWQLLNQDSELGRNTLSLSTTDGKTFYQLLDDGAGTAASYKATLQDNGKFLWDLISNDSGISRKTKAQSAWITKDVTTTNVTQPGTTQTGTANDDNLQGTSYDDSLSGSAGNDTLFGYSGNDTLVGSSGDDEIVVGAGNDTVNATDANSRGSFENDYIQLGVGSDTVILGDEAGSYYMADGWNDAVFISQFQVGVDRLELFGNADQYVVYSNSNGTTIASSQDGTSIAFLDGVTSFDLNSNATFVGEVAVEEVAVEEVPVEEVPVEEVPVEEVTPEPTPSPIPEPEPAPEPSPEPIPEPTAYNEVLGTQAGDYLLGTSNADRLIGFNGMDGAEGRGGADVFVLGDANGSFYIQDGWNDSLYISDFEVGTDQLELHGAASDYSIKNSADGAWIYAETAAKDPIAYLKGVTTLNLNSLTYV